jgi:hypothetical protein
MNLPVRLEIGFVSLSLLNQERNNLSNSAGYYNDLFYRLAMAQDQDTEKEEKKEKVDKGKEMKEMEGKETSRKRNANIKKREGPLIRALFLF